MLQWVSDYAIAVDLSSHLRNCRVTKYVARPDVRGVKYTRANEKDVNWGNAVDDLASR
jgi:hypothetical protein